MGWGLPPDIYILCRCFFCSFLKAGRQGWGGGGYIVKFSELAQIFLGIRAEQGLHNAEIRFAQGTGDCHKRMYDCRANALGWSRVKMLS